MVKDYVNIFPGPNFMSPKWRRLLKRGVPKDKFHCRNVKPREKSCYIVITYSVGELITEKAV